jgi:hypothetical protein
MLHHETTECINRNELSMHGCMYTGPYLAMIENHEAKCASRQVKCPGLRKGQCLWKGPLLGLRDHWIASQCLQVRTTYVRVQQHKVGKTKKWA